MIKHIKIDRFKVNCDNNSCPRRLEQPYYSKSRSSFRFDEFNEKIRENSYETHGPYISTLGEAHLKVDLFLGKFDGGVKYYFRGQNQACHNVNSRISRCLSNEEKICDNENNISNVEIQMVDKFITELKQNVKLKEIIFGNFDLLDESDPSWFAIVQHYGDLVKFDENRDCSTRLIDVTDSLDVAIYFACADWDSGDVPAQKCDGKVFLIPIDFPKADKFKKHKADFKENIFETLYHDNVNYYVEPNLPNTRIANQKGLFIYTKSIVDSIEMNKGLELLVPYKSKKKLLIELSERGIDYNYITGLFKTDSE